MFDFELAMAVVVAIIFLVIAIGRAIARATDMRNRRGISFQRYWEDLIEEVIKGCGKAVLAFGAVVALYWGLNSVLSEMQDRWIKYDMKHGIAESVDHPLSQVNKK